MGRLQELIVGYSSENIWNIYESSCFFKALPDEGLVGRRANKQKVAKKPNQRFTIVFFVTAQKIKFSTKDYYSKCDQIRSFLRIWSHLLKKSIMENFIFWAVC